MASVKFKVSHEDQERISRIIDRAWPMVRSLYASQLDLMMDLKATHANGCKMDFQRLLDADDFNFFHDISGICGHLDRKTGKLVDHFLPRCAARSFT